MLAILREHPIAVILAQPLEHLFDDLHAAVFRNLQPGGIDQTHIGEMLHDIDPEFGLSVKAHGGQYGVLLVLTVGD